MEELPSIIISGSIAIDRIMNFGGHFPELIKMDKLHSLSLSVLLDNLHDTYGGVGGNIAYSMALLGEHPILLGSVGKDAKAHIADLAKTGVNTKYIHISKLPTASFNVITDGGNRQIGGFYLGAMADSRSLSLSPWKSKRPFVIISPHDPKAMHHQVKQCKAYGLRLFYDVGQQANSLGDRDILSGIEATEILIANDYEITVICHKIGMSASKLKALVPIVVTTLGGDGSIIEGKNVPSALKIDAVKPKKIIDPTGAGDAYRAGFLYGYIRGWNLVTCGQLGSVCASYVVERLGTQTHSFNFETVKKRYKLVFNQALSNS